MVPAANPAASSTTRSSVPSHTYSCSYVACTSLVCRTFVAYAPHGYCTYAIVCCMHVASYVSPVGFMSVACMSHVCCRYAACMLHVCCMYVACMLQSHEKCGTDRGVVPVTSCPHHVSLYRHRRRHIKHTIVDMAGRGRVPLFFFDRLGKVGSITLCHVYRMRAHNFCTHAYLGGVRGGSRTRRVRPRLRSVGSFSAASCLSHPVKTPSISRCQEPARQSYANS